MANPIITKIGDVSAYLDAVAHGFEGTRAEFGELLANSANYAQSAESAASAASASAATATTKTGEATTAATAAQTAKTQTEAAASQALTDISTAESGAISAVQTEGATQTANATAQAQAAAQSATTASTKASEASASATSAGQSATEAATSATSAAQSASAAQSVLESIPEEYSDLSEDVDKLKADLSNVNERLDVVSDVLQYPVTDRIEKVTIGANGLIITDATHDLYLQSVTAGDTIGISITEETSFVYAFFTSKPAIGSASYNSSRSYVGNAIATGVAVPTTATWIAVRVLSGTDATITPKESKVISALQTSVTALNNWKTNTGSQVLVSNYSIKLPDADNAEINSSYVLTFVPGTTTIPANLPISKIEDTNSMLMTIGQTRASRVQYYITGNKMWQRVRVSVSEWSAWSMISDGVEEPIYIGANRDYTTLRAGIAEAIKTNGRKVYVDGEEYDLLEEFADVIADFPSSGYQGIKLENDVDVTFSPNAKVTFLYTGSDTNVMRYFSPFFAGANGGFKIDGLNITASKCRYCIHDDAKGVSSNTPYYRKVVIKNCTLSIDNTGNTNYPQCVGGGLTDNEDVELINNIMQSAQSVSYGNPVASWHGCQTGGTSHIVAVGNYCKNKGTLRFSHYGIATADDATPCIVHDNSLGSAIINTYEKQSTYPNANMAVFEWNNAIRA